MHVNVDKKTIEIDITHDHKELNEWIERIAKTANEICDDPDYTRIKMNEQHTGFIMESNDAGGLGCLGWAIERNINDIPSKLRPTFQEIRDDVKSRKEDLERP